MKITKIEIFPIGMAYAQPYEQATGVTEMARRVVVKMSTDEGLTGWGEASTLLPNRTGESAQVIAVVIADHLAPLLIGENPLEIQRLMQKLRSASMDKYGFLYSKTAIDIALHDIAGKAYGVPVAALLGGIVQRSIGVSRSVPLKSPKEVAKDSERLVSAGYKMITVKAGIDPAADLKRVEAVRGAVGPEFPVEVDANQGYRADVAVQTLSRMEENWGIVNIEQPCPWWDIAGMAEVTRALRMTVTADESVLCPAEAMNFVRFQAADAFTIKVAKCGGLLQAKRIAAIAEAAGLSCNMGSEHPAGIGTAAMAHFWASTPEIAEVGYGSPLERFTDDILKEPIRFERGLVYLPEGPGLGIEVDEAKLRKFGGHLEIA